MVYESSTRRIYSSSSPRPVISTSYSYSPYSSEDSSAYYTNANYFIQLPMLQAASPVGPVPVVTKIRRQPHLVLAYTPGTSKGHIINPIAIPRVAHRRLASVPPPPHRALNGQNYYEMLESGISGHFGNRIILVRYRPTPTPVPQSKVLYIEDVTDSNNYGKETRLLRRELSPSPSLYGYGSPWDTSSAMIPISRPLYSLHNIPLRSASEVKEISDVRRLYVRDRNPDVGYSPINKALLYRMPMPVYVDPTLPQNYYIGRGNLACLSFAGGRPIPKRRRFYPEYEDKIRDEVIFRSFYTKLRDAAAVGRSPGKRPVYQPIYYSKKTILGEENVPKRQPKESKWVERALANEKPPTPRANRPSVQPASVATETVVVPPRKESLKLAKTPATPPPVQPINVTLPKPRKSITEIIREDLPKVETLPEENVTVKMPKEPTPAPPAEVEAKAEETVVVPAKAEPPREPTPPPPAPEKVEPEPEPVKEEVPPPEPVTEVPAEPAKEVEVAAPVAEEVKETAPVEKPQEPVVSEPAPVPQTPAVPEETTAPETAAPAPTEPPAPQAAEEAAAPAPEVPAPAEEPAPPAAAVIEEPPAPEPAAAAPETPAEEAAVPTAETSTAPAVEAEATAAPATTEATSEPPSEVSAPVASGDQESHDEASNKGEVEDIQLDEEITLDEVCDVEENDLEIESDDPEANESTVAAVEVPLPVVESPQTTEGLSATEPANDQQDVVPPAPVSIVVADIDGPIPVQEEAPAVQEEPLTVEQIQAEAERRRAEFAQLLEEHAELVTTVTKLERVAVIVSKSCAEALAQQGT